MRQLILLAALGLALAGPSAAHAEDYKVGPIEIAGPTVRAMLPGARVGGGYLTIVNHGTEPDVFLGGTADRAQAVLPHHMMMDNGVIVMRTMKDGVPISAGGSVALLPGGDHLMFMNVDRPFQPGETIKATLHFQKAGSVEVSFAVGPIGGPIGNASSMTMDGPMTGSEHAGHAGHAQ